MFAEAPVSRGEWVVGVDDLDGKEVVELLVSEPRPRTVRLL